MNLSQRTMTMMPCVFVNHGGGPSHLYASDDDPIKSHLLKVGARFSDKDNKPSSILVLSAHNEAAPSLKVSSLYNSKKSSAREYSAPGDPKLATRVQKLLKNNNIPCDVVKKRNLDHGALAPLMIGFPDADIPVETLSLHKSMSAEAHLRIGEALQPLRKEGVLIMGSGMSFHNLGSLFSSNFFGNLLGYDFDQMLVKAVTNPDPVRRNQILAQWEKFPGARSAHPREEHLMPLLVVAGAAGSDIGKQNDSFDFMGAAVSGFSFP